MDLDFSDLEDFSQENTKDHPAERPAVEHPAVDRPAVDRHVADHHDQPKNRRKYLYLCYLLYLNRFNIYFFK